MGIVIHVRKIKKGVSALSDSVAEQVVSLLASRGASLATAESCTGGLIGHRITNVPGSSSVFRGGIVAYSNAVKVSLLGVSAGLLKSHGAVSDVVAQSMAEGVMGRLETDWSVSVTGIAGPGGGTTEKPVGLVYIAVAWAVATHVAEHHFSGSRAAIKEQTADAALIQLLECLEG